MFPGRSRKAVTKPPLDKGNQRLRALVVDLARIVPLLENLIEELKEAGWWRALRRAYRDLGHILFEPDHVLQNLAGSEIDNPDWRVQ